MKTKYSANIADITIKLVLSYFLVLAGGTIVCAVLYTIYSLCTSLVAGQGLPSFDLGVFLTGVFIFMPIVLIISGVLICFYLIRNSSHSWVPLTVYALLYVATWLFLLPLDFSLHQKMSTSKVFDKEEVTLSSGYFRHEDTGHIFYYSRVWNYNVADGICIAPDAADGGVYTFSGVSLPKNSDFTDNLIKDTVDMPPSVSLLVTSFRDIIKIARTAFNSGFFAWLCFVTISLALVSVAGLRHISRWRLVNVLLLISATAFIVVLNIFSYTPSPISDFTEQLNSALAFLPLVNPFAVICNIALAVLFSVIGFAIDVKRKGATAELADDFEEEA